MTLRRWIVSTLTIAAGCVLLLCGCSEKSDRESADSERIAALTEEIDKLQSTIDALQKALDSEQKRTAMLKHLTEAAGSNDAAVQQQLSDAVLTDSEEKTEDKSLEGSEPDTPLAVAELDRLKKENERLRRELERLRLSTQAEKSALTDKTQDRPIQEAAELSGEWDMQKSPVQKVDFLGSLTQLSRQRSPEILPILQRALADPDPQVGLAASELLKNYRSSDAFSAIEQALSSDDERIRINALHPLGTMADPRAADLLSDALNDVSEQVRREAMAKITEQSGNIQLDALAAAIVCPYEDVKQEALSTLQLRGDKDCVPIIIQGLQDADPAYVDEVNSALTFLINRKFKSHQEAVSWWEMNQGRFDDDLFEK